MTIRVPRQDETKAHVFAPADGPRIVSAKPEAGPAAEATATRIAGLGPDDARLPRAKALHKVVCKITGWSKGNFGPWDDLTDDQREWWVAQWVFVVTL